MRMKSKIIKTVVHAPHLTNAGRPKPVPKPQRVGLGDVVAMVAKPIARAVDNVTGSKMEGCQPCSVRQQKLNDLVPDILRPFRK
jgi:hypothetical protein